MKTDEGETTVQHNILSERPEAQKEAILWAKETQERIKRSDEATKVLKEKLTPIFLANIQKEKLNINKSSMVKWIHKRNSVRSCLMESKKPIG